MNTIEGVLIRLRAEFREMPGLQLKPKQVWRLCGVDHTLGNKALHVLVEEKFLRVTSDGHYARQTDETIHRARPAKALLRDETHLVKAS